jgi:hypothetical protein
MTVAGESDPTDKCIIGKISVAINACDSAAKHYDSYYRGFMALDAKGQGTVTVSGLILAAMAAFLKDGRVPVLVSSSRWWILLILAAPAAALVAAIISLFGTRLVDVVVPFDASAQIHEAKILAALDCTEFSQRHILDYYLERLTHWNRALDSIESAISRKARRVSLAQKMMLVGLLTLLLLFIVILLKS